MLEVVWEGFVCFVLFGEFGMVFGDELVFVLLNWDWLFGVVGGGYVEKFLGSGVCCGGLCRILNFC